MNMEVKTNPSRPVSSTRYTNEEKNKKPGSLTLTGIAPRIVMAALGCYFITMTATYIGITRSESITINLIKSYGGGKFKHFF